MQMRSSRQLQDLTNEILLDSNQFFISRDQALKLKLLSTIEGITLWLNKRGLSEAPTTNLGIRHEHIIS
jgi:hypothetical protein